jgi:thymidylate kinase
MQEGVFIVIYGTNNIGKSTQVDMLVEALKGLDLPVEHIKYPIYDLTPTGPKINEILRSGKKQEISEEELQKLYADNRRDYQFQLCKMLAEGINVIAEDYTGCGLAWGWTKGADIEELIEINKGLLKPDAEILLDGERFIEAKEEGHLHESKDELFTACRANHLKLAGRFGWQVVNANQTREEVHTEVLACLEKTLRDKLKD